MLMHPLTPEAAGLLLKEPGLGRAVDARYLADRTVIETGQRFYYLEVPRGQVRTVRSAQGGHALARTSDTRVVLDFPRGELRVLLFYSEAEAQSLATQLRARAPSSALLPALKRGLEERLASLLSGSPSRGLRVIHEAVPTQQLAAPAVATVMRLAGRPLSGLLLTWLLDVFRQEMERRYDVFAGQLAKAADAEADGVTLTVVFARPSFFERMRRLLSGGALAAAAGLPASLTANAMGQFTVTVQPGYSE
jgi:hypothetical protein